MNAKPNTKTPHFIGQSFLLIFCLLACGCSMDEDVISECERVHPNSLQGQLVCQSRVAARNEKIRKEKEAKSCVDSDESRMRKFAFDIKEVVKNSTDLELSDLKIKLEQQFKPQVFNLVPESTRKNRYVINSFIATTCNASSYALLINVNEMDVTGKGTLFRVWENSPPELTEFTRQLSEFTWVKK